MYLIKYYIYKHTSDTDTWLCTHARQQSIALTEVDAGFQEKRDLLTEHLRLVSGAGQCGARKFRWLKAATDCRPGFV